MKTQVRELCGVLKIMHGHVTALMSFNRLPCNHGDKKVGFYLQTVVQPSGKDHASSDQGPSATRRSYETIHFEHPHRKVGWRETLTSCTFLSVRTRDFGGEEHIFPRI